MDCIEGKEKDIRKLIYDKLRHEYLGMNTEIDGKTCNFIFEEIEKEYYFKVLTITRLNRKYAKDAANRFIESFIENVSNIDAEHILGKGFSLKDWVKSKPEKMSNGLIRTYLTIEAPQSYKELFDIANNEDLSVKKAIIDEIDETRKVQGIEDTPKEEIPLLKMTDVSSEQSIRFQVQKFFDNNPHKNKVYVGTNKGVVLYTRVNDGVARDGDQLTLKLNAPTEESDKEASINMFNEIPDPVYDMQEDFIQYQTQALDIMAANEQIMQDYSIIEQQMKQDYETSIREQVLENYFPEGDTTIDSIDTNIQELYDEDMTLSFDEYLEKTGVNINKEDRLDTRDFGKTLGTLIDTIIYDKKKTLKKLKERVSSLKKLKKSSDKRIKYQSYIKKIEKDIDNLEKKRKKYERKPVMDTIREEISFLKSIVEPIQDDAGNIIKDENGNDIYHEIDSDLITVELFEQRLNTLCMYLLGRDINGKTIKDFDSKIVQDEEITPIVNQLLQIVDNYSRRRAELIYNYAMSDISKKHFKSEADRKKFQDVAVQFLSNPEKTVEELFKKILPSYLLQIADAEQGLGIFGAIIKSYFQEEKKSFERTVKSLYDELKQLEKRVKRKMKDYSSEIFFKKDSFGNITNRLINLFSDSFKNFNYILTTYQSNYHYFSDPSYSNKTRKDSFYKFKNLVLKEMEIFRLNESYYIWAIIKQYDLENGTDFYNILSEYRPADINISNNELENIDNLKVRYSNGSTNYFYESYNSRNSEHFIREVLEKQAQQLISYFDSITSEERQKDKNFILSDGHNPFVFSKKFKDANDFKGDTEKLWSTDYVTLIPRDGKYYDDNFKKISSNKDLQKLWGKYSELIVDNINRALIESGAKITEDEIPIDFDFTQSELFKSYIFFKRWGLRLRDWYLNTFYSGEISDGINNIKDSVSIPTSSGNLFLKKLKTLLKRYDTTSLIDIAHAKGINHKSFKEFLQDFNFEENSLDDKNRKFYEKLQKRYTNYLASLIASQEVLSTVNKDLLENIGKFAQSVILMQARKKTQVFADTVLNFINNYNNEENSSETDSYKTYQKFLNYWVQRNIYGNTTVQDYAWAKKKRGKGKKRDIIQDKISSKLLYLETLPLTFFNETSYEIVITLKDENHTSVSPSETMRLLQHTNIRESLLHGPVKEIEILGKTYYVDTTYYKNHKTKEIKRDEYISAYKDLLLKENEKNMVYTSFRSIFDGLRSINAQQSLMFNAESGVKNRYEGEFTNVRLAASGYFSFDTKDLYAAKRFLNLAILSKSTPSVARVISKKHYTQLKIYELFTNQMSIFQDHTNLDLSDNESYSFTSWAIEYPETHNQGEVILSTLIHNNIKVKDVNGKEHNFFNTNSRYGNFVIFDENEAILNNRLKLKPEFDTVENKTLWYNWTAYKDDYRSINLIDECKRNVTRSQGNYEDEDIAAVQSNTLGRTIWQFKKWAYSHLNQRYKNTEIDYLSGELNKKGMVNTIGEHPSVIIPFMIMETFLSITTSPKTLISNIRMKNHIFNLSTILFNVFKALFSIAAPTYICVKLIREFLCTESTKHSLKEELKLMFSFISECMTRTVTTAINQGSLKIDQYTTNSMNLNKKAVNLTEKVNDIFNKSVPEETRKALSGAAQQIANHLYLYGFFILLNFALNYVLEEVTECEEGDEECLERKAKIKEHNLKSMIFIINLFNNLVADDDKWLNPFLFFDNMGNISVIDKIQRLVKIFDKLQKSDVHFGEKVLYSVKNIPQPFIPNQIANPLVFGIVAALDEDYRQQSGKFLELPFQDRRIYDSKLVDYPLQNREYRVKTNYSAYKDNIDAIADNFVKNLQKTDPSINTDKYKKWFKKEFKTRVFGTESQDEVIMMLMEDDDYVKTLKDAVTNAEFYSREFYYMNN